MTLAEYHKKELSNKYQLYTMRDFIRCVNPDKKGHCKYLITFTDNSQIEVVMTSRQRSGILKSKLYNDIKSIGGQGHVKPFHTPGELPVRFEPGKFRLIIEQTDGTQFKGHREFDNMIYAIDVAAWEKQHMKKVHDAFICQDIKPVFK